MSVQRQVAWNSTGFCKHTRVEEVRSADGAKLYGQRCSECAAAWGVGRCDGCGDNDVRLEEVSGAGERFCTLDCKEAVTRRRAKETRASLKVKIKVAKDRAAREAAGGWLPAAGGDLVCAHPRLEDVLNGYDEVIGHRCLQCHAPVKRSAA